jgi:DHA1 family inner membrane transport protein
MVDNFPAAIIFLALWFVASGAFVTTQQTLLSILAPEQRGSSLSWNNSIMYAGTALGVCLLGAIMDRGYEIGILELTFTVLAITCVIFLSYYRRKITGVEHHG